MHVQKLQVQIGCHQRGDVVVLVFVVDMPQLSVGAGNDGEAHGIQPRQKRHREGVEHHRVGQVAGASLTDSVDFVPGVLANLLFAHQEIVVPALFPGGEFRFEVIRDPDGLVPGKALEKSAQDHVCEQLAVAGKDERAQVPHLFQREFAKIQRGVHARRRNIGGEFEAEFLVLVVRGQVGRQGVGLARKQRQEIVGTGETGGFGGHDPDGSDDLPQSSCGRAEKS